MLDTDYYWLVLSDELIQTFRHLQSTLVSVLSWTRQLEGETHSSAPRIGTTSTLLDAC